MGFGVRMVTAFMTEFVEEGQIYKMPLWKWDPSYYSHKQNEIIFCQTLINQHNGYVTMLCALFRDCLKDSNNFSLNETLSYVDVLLFNQNSSTLKSFLS